MHYKSKVGFYPSNVLWHNRHTSLYCKLFAVLQMWTLLDYYTTSQKSKKKKKLLGKFSSSIKSIRVYCQFLFTFQLGSVYWKITQTNLPDLYWEKLKLLFFTKTSCYLFSFYIWFMVCLVKWLHYFNTTRHTNSSIIYCRRRNHNFL